MWPGLDSQCGALCCYVYIEVQDFPCAASLWGYDSLCEVLQGRCSVLKSDNEVALYLNGTIPLHRKQAVWKCCLDLLYVCCSKVACTS